MFKIITLFLLLLFSNCATGELLSLGENKITVNYEDGKKITTYHGRNLWAFPAIVVFYPVALSIDVAVIPFYLYNEAEK